MPGIPSFRHGARLRCGETQRDGVDQFSACPILNTGAGFLVYGTLWLHNIFMSADYSRLEESADGSQLMTPHPAQSSNPVSSPSSPGNTLDEEIVVVEVLSGALVNNGEREADVEELWAVEMIGLLVIAGW